MLDMGDLCTLEQTQTKTAAGGGAILPPSPCTTNTTFCFCLSGLCSGDYSRLGRVPIRSFKEEPLGIADVIF